MGVSILLPIPSSLLLLFRWPATTHQEDVSPEQKRVRVWVSMPPDCPAIDRALRVRDWRVGHIRAQRAHRLRHSFTPSLSIDTTRRLRGRAANIMAGQKPIEELAPKTALRPCCFFR
jgi:hypothetical protein